MDDKQQSDAGDAQAAREKGAQLEYDAQDEDALSQTTPPPASATSNTDLDKENHE